MERKSIGQFISVLRKASGMTQKELAEKLNVSDKAVSRWERDECAPDISVIPVIAEIFDVTCDELLKGERITAEAYGRKSSEEKTEKQFKRLLSSNTAKYHKRSIISISLILAGFICAMIGNYAFLRSYLGFFLGTIFFLFAAVSHSIFTIDAFSSVKDSEFDSEEIEKAKRHYFNLSYAVYAAILISVSLCLPLVCLSPGAEWGLQNDTWLEGAVVFGGIGIVTLIPIYGFASKWARKKKVCLPTQKEKANEDEIKKLKTRYRKKFIACAVATAVLFSGFNIINLNYEYFFGERFDNMEDFITFMQTDMYDPTVPVEVTYFVGTHNEEIEEDESIYYDDEGNIISKQEAITEYIYAEDGSTVIGKYLDINKSVHSISIKWENGSPVFYVLTNKAAMTNYEFEQTGFVIFSLICFVEIVALSASYYKKNKELI